MSFYQLPFQLAECSMIIYLTFSNCFRVNPRDGIIFHYKHLDAKNGILKYLLLRLFLEKDLFCLNLFHWQPNNTRLRCLLVSDLKVLFHVNDDLFVPSGKPQIATINSSPEGLHCNSYNLTWSVKSYEQLTKVRILFRKMVRIHDLLTQKSLNYVLN